MKYYSVVGALALLVVNVNAFIIAGVQQKHVHYDHSSASLLAKKNNVGDNEGDTGKFNLFQDFFANLDDVVDDFVMKRMGAGEQWYGKRKSNPSGKFDGNYNGMGKSDFYRIEIAKVQKEEIEKKKKQRRLENEQNRKF